MRSSSNGWTEAKSLTAGSVFDLDKADVLAGVRAQRDRTIAMLRGLTPEQWETPVVPRWRVREVAGHLVSSDEGVLTGRVVTAGFTKRADLKLSKIEVWNDKQAARWADRPIPEILRGLDVWAKRIERLSKVVPSFVARPAIPTPFGRISLLWLTSLRIFDEWVHDEDIRRAMKMPSDDAPATMRPVARQVQAGIPVQTLPRVPEDVEGRVVLTFSDVQLPPLGFDMGERRFGYGVETADARISGPSSVITMVCARRDTWKDAEASGGLKLEGDRTVAETFLEALLLV
jgi:uncharacterized protein (TIGR03083 family)